MISDEQEFQQRVRHSKPQQLVWLRKDILGFRDGADRTVQLGHVAHPFLLRPTFAVKDRAARSGVAVPIARYGTPYGKMKKRMRKNFKGRLACLAGLATCRDPEEYLYREDGV
jgi:hypothetical protein